MSRVLQVRLICSDGDCAARYEAYGSDIGALGCECGCGLQELGWPQPIDGPPGREGPVELVPFDR